MIEQIKTKQHIFFLKNFDKQRLTRCMECVAALEEVEHIEKGLIKRFISTGNVMY